MFTFSTTTSDVEFKSCETESCPRVSAALCHHCNKNVCRRHFDEHADQLVQELNPLADTINVLDEKIHSFCVKENKQTVLDKLTRWRDESIENINSFYELKKNKLDSLFQEREEVFQQRMSYHLEVLGTLRDQTAASVKEGDVTFQQLQELKRNLNELTDGVDKTHSLIDCDPKPLLFDSNSVPLYSRMNVFMTGGTLLCVYHQMKLNQFYGNAKQKWELIYKATRDGFGADDFHRCSDNNGATMTTIQSENGNYLFGGYSNISWKRDNNYKSDPTAFLFTLTNPHDIPPTKFFQKLDILGSVGHSKTGGPCFGGVKIDQRQIRDVSICANANTTENSTSGFPAAYIDTTGIGETLFTGTQSFMVEEIEVYKRLNEENDCVGLHYH